MAATALPLHCNKNAAPAGSFLNPGGGSAFQAIEIVIYITREGQNVKGRIIKALNPRGLFQKRG
jgi:hypothetical protein